MADETFFDELDAAVRGLRNKGVNIVASSRGQEPKVELLVEDGEAGWIVGQPERLLSQAILDDNDSADEVGRIAQGLRVTIMVLENALAQGYGRRQSSMPLHGVAYPVEAERDELIRGIRRAVFRASGMEARRAIDAEGGVVHDSPVRDSGDAQGPSQ